MKKILLAAFALLVSFGAQAQIVSVNSHTIRTIKKEKPASESIWIMRLGLGFDKMKGDDWKGEDGLELGSKLGYDLSYEFNKQLGNVPGLYWGMEFGLGSRGYSASYEYSDEDWWEKQDEKLVAHNVRVSPFIIGYKYQLSDNVALDAHLGAFASFDYVGKYRIEGSDEEESWDEDFGMGDWEEDLNYDWNRFDAGIRLGGGIWYKNFNLDVTWHKGFIKPLTIIDDYEDVEMKATASNVLVRLGIAF